MTVPVSLSLQEAADTLDVHYMTVYRYVRQGVLPARRSGRSWLVDADELERFRVEREGGTKTGGGGGGDRSSRRQVDWGSRLERRLLAGDRQGAMGVLDGALGAGADPIEVYVDIIGPAMAGVGDGWASGRIDVAVEHRASVVASQCIAVLSVRFTRRGVRRGKVIVGAAPGERHSLPARLVAEVTRLAGFEVDDLGADVPVASFVAAAEAAEELRAVMVSATIEENLGGAREAVAALQRSTSVPIFLGGAGVADAAVATAHGADAWAPDARVAVEVLEELLEG